MTSAPSRTYRTALRDGAIPVPFDPREVFGAVRAPVVVTVGAHQFRSTISSMDGYWVPLRQSHREAAGLDGSEIVTVTLTLDTAPRTVEPPPDLAQALRAAGAAWDRWTELPFTHQREYAEAIAEAKKPETRARRIAQAVAKIAARPPRKTVTRAAPAAPATKKPAPAAKKPAAKKPAAKKPAAKKPAPAAKKKKA